MFDGAGLKSRIAENRLPVNLESSLYPALIDCFQGESMIPVHCNALDHTHDWKEVNNGRIGVNETQ
jgi:hypothetical protein